jgi:UDP-N-acetylglucosamine 2-epimerase
MKIVTVVGARPQFVKAAALSRVIDRLDAADRVDEVLVHTGQHYDASMSDVFFDELGLRAPSHHLGVGSGSHGRQTGSIMIGLDDVLERERPDAVMVYGDTNSTVAAALCSAKMHIPVAHVEAGLRSFDRTMPEETNRVVADHVSEVLFCPSAEAQRNLAAEGIVAGVHVVGDVMRDVFLTTEAAARSASRLDAVSTRTGIDPAQPFVLTTMHRPANTDDPQRLAGFLGALGEIARNGLQVLWPVHPRLGVALSEFDVPTGVTLVEPLGHLDLVAVLGAAKVVATDSGGLQKEAYWSGVPCVTTRSTTEWVETVDEGWNVLVDDDWARLVQTVVAATPGNSDRSTYGDGHAAERIVEILVARFSGGR